LTNGGYAHRSVCHGRGEYARDEDGDGFHEIHVNTMEGFWSLLRSWPEAASWYFPGKAASVSGILRVRP